MNSPQKAFTEMVAPPARPELATIVPIRPDPKDGARRGDRRFGVNQSVQLQAVENADQVWTAQIRDISRHGMQLVMDRPVSEGLQVRIEWNGREIDGIVRNHKAYGAEHRVGIELSSSWESLVSDVLARQAEKLRTSNLVMKRQAANLQQQADMLDLTYDMIVVTEMNGSVSSWNHAAEEVYGWTREEATGRNLDEMLKTVFAGGRRQVEMVLLAKGRWDGELIHHCKDGSRIVVGSRWVLRRNPEGKPLAIVAIGRDITARKQAEQELVSSAAALSTKNQELAAALQTAHPAGVLKNSSLASFSHAFRTPLNGIIGISQLLHDGAMEPVTSGQRECLSDILNCSGQLLGLIDHILDISSTGAQEVAVQPGKICVEKPAGGVIDSFTALATIGDIGAESDMYPLIGVTEGIWPD